jgi:thymidylate synthase
MNKADKYFTQNIEKIIYEGSWDENPRPKYPDGTPSHSKFITGVFEEYDISKGEYPIPTVRTVAIKTGIKEILWIYQKQTSSLRVAREMGINWWEEWNIGDDSIGQRYGATVGRYNLIDRLLTGLVDDPFGRRHIINMFQYHDLFETQGLYPCAYETLWSVRNVENEMVLDMTLVQRSSDYLTANTINKGQYLALQMMVAGHCGYKIGKFVHLVQNLHVYDRHLEYVGEILNNQNHNIKPYFKLKTNKNFYDYSIDDFEFFDFDKLKPIDGKLELGI